MALPGYVQYTHLFVDPEENLKEGVISPFLSNATVQHLFTVRVQILAITKVLKYHQKLHELKFNQYLY